MGASAFSQHTAQLIDDEIRRLAEEAHQTAIDIIQSHREQHKLIAEALLKYETLDEKQILSLFKTGEMPAKAGNEFPSEKAATFEESKRELERREAEKQQAQSQTASDSSAADEPSFPSESQAMSTATSADSAETSAATSATSEASADSAATSGDDSDSQA